VVLGDLVVSKREKVSQPSFQDIYLAHAPAVRALLYRYGVAGDMDDLVQETFIKIWKGMDEFKGDSSLTTWIYRVAINVAKNDKRAKKRKWWLLLSHDDTAIDLASSAADAEKILSDQTALDKAIATLSPKLKETLVLFSIKELEIEEIAKILDISPGTVKSRLHQARKNLIEYFGESENIP
jgi:RNA polymerase sigma-70 factor (ECF subfamily)